MKLYKTVCTVLSVKLPTFRNGAAKQLFEIFLTCPILFLLWTVNLKCSKLDLENAEVSTVEIRYITPADNKRQSAGCLKKTGNIHIRV